MKFIHTADLHLASEMESRLSPEKAKQRRRELFETFKRLAAYAEDEGVTAILLCGDIFDENKVPLREKKNFVDVVRAHPSVDFLCLAGNHDESLSRYLDLPGNLRVFGDAWTKYSYGEVDVYGVELNDVNFSLIYATLLPDEHKTNVVMLHGQNILYASKPAPDKIILPSLADRHIDYLALGHIHSFREGKLDDRGVWCMSGCLEGRGYDECGEKGFVLLDVENGKIARRFVPFALRTIVEKSVDLTGADGEWEIEKRLLEALSSENPENMIRVYLEGRPEMHARIDVKALEALVERQFFACSIKNRTKASFDLETLRKELSLQGAFVDLVLSNDALPPEEKEEILRCGLLALDGEEAIFE